MIDLTDADDHLVLAERACLEALRCDQERWGGVMTRDLFTGPRRDLWLAITGAEDPRDELQVFDWGVANEDKLESRRWGVVAIELADPTYEAPWHLRGQEWLDARLAMLTRRRDRNHIQRTLSDGADWMRAGASTEEIEEYLDRAFAKQTASLGVYRNVPVYSDEAASETPDERAVVRGVLYPRGITVLAGPGGIGKSWLAIDMIRSIVQERFWLGLPCELLNVAYLSFEMSETLVRKRIKMLGGIHAERLWVIGQDRNGGSIEILDPAHRAALRSFVAVHDIGVLIVDPLRQAHSGDENDSTDMSKVLAGFSNLGCAVLLLHHVAKGSGETRGSSAIRDRADAVITCAKRDDAVVISWEKRPRFEAVSGDIGVEFTQPTPDSMLIKRLW